MTCDHCGEGVAEHWQFCPRCGEPTGNKKETWEERHDRMCTERQAKCSHPEHRVSTSIGRYCDSNDRNPVIYTCELCGANWTKWE